MVSDQHSPGGGAARPNLEAVRAVLGPDIGDAEAETVVASYLALARAVAAFPSHELLAVEPPLRSAPGPARP